MRFRCSEISTDTKGEENRLKSFGSIEEMKSSFFFDLSVDNDRLENEDDDDDDGILNATGIK